jgi:cell wall-associated NlpC family hydrolase
MADTLDPRLNVYRDDLADARLEGRVSAQRFVSGVEARVISGAPALRRRPDDAAPQDTQLLFGERVDVFERHDGWAWVQNRRDGYVGYCHEDRLGALNDAPALTHRVSVLRTYLYPEASLKVPPRDLLSLESALSIVDVDARWARLADGGFVHAGHLSPLAVYETDIAGVAERFLETPYLWGGKTSVGLDCSGLVQLALNRCGVECLRDTDMQETSVGHDVAIGPQAMRRGDLVFWPGHVGIMVDGLRIIHANATDMTTRIWTLAALDDHIEKMEGRRMTRIRRMEVV